jgi:hypothetical protein
MIFKKSQAALEFLTTYAWAFLVILIMIGALAYFGILNPNKLLPERCSFGSEFECRDFNIDKTGDNLDIKLVNNVGEPLVVSTFVISSDADQPLTCKIDSGQSLPSITAPWVSGLDHDFKYECKFDPGTGEIDYWTDAGFVAGQKGKISVAVTYYTVKAGSAYSHVINGEVFATVK